MPSMPSELRVIALEGVPEVRTGDDLAALLNDAIARTPHAAPLREDDVLVVTQKVVSKAEGRMVQVDPDDPLSHKKVVEAESVRIVRRRGRWKSSFERRAEWYAWSRGC